MGIFYYGIFYLLLQISVNVTGKPVTTIADPYRGNVDPTLIEGDMRREPTDNRERRAVSTFDAHKWDNAIVPYDFDTRAGKILSTKAKNEILKAIENIENKTCMKFVKRTNEPNYVLFTKGAGCSSFVGNIRRGAQEVSIGEFCIDMSVIAHEILHALGFIHEHTRLDRDQYIFINYTNILTGLEDQFQKYTSRRDISEITTLDTPYDKSSVMHYKRFTFTNKADPDTRIVIAVEAHMTLYSRTGSDEKLGSENGLSNMDIIRVNKHYNCPVITTTSTTTTKEPTTTTTTTKLPTTTTTTKLPTTTTTTKIPTTTTTIKIPTTTTTKVSPITLNPTTTANKITTTESVTTTESIKKTVPTVDSKTTLGATTTSTNFPGIRRSSGNTLKHSYILLVGSALIAFIYLFK